MSRSRVKYEPLSVDDDDTNGVGHLHSKARPNRRRLYIFLAQSLLNVFLLVFGWSYHQRGLAPRFPYSPMQDDVRYEAKRFSPSLNENATMFMGQSDKVDDRWSEVSSFGIYQIPEEVANRLLEKTMPLHNDPSNYQIGFEVFHQLHCLDMLRIWFHPEHYPRSNLAHEYENGHLDHCLRWLQQTTMCMADVSPVPWQWDEERRMTLPKLDSLHECRSWDDVWKWSKGHRIKVQVGDTGDAHEHHHH